MDVRVHGNNVQISDELRSIVMEKVGHAGRIFDDGPTLTDVEFTEAANPRNSNGKVRVEITSTLAGQTVRVEAAAHDDRSALDGAIGKYERQLRRLKERLIQRNRQSSNKRLNPAEAWSDEEEQEGLRIVRTKRFALKPMTPEEAALQMEMLGHSFFFFLNAESDQYGVLYNRRDGSLGLIEAE